MDDRCCETGTPALWRRFKDDSDAKAREQLVLTYAPLVKYVAGRLVRTLPAHVDEADLISYGLLGLMSAIERYEPTRNVKFETFAVIRIRGAILDELRALDWVPRSVRSEATSIERATTRLAHRLRRTPKDREIADDLGIPLRKLRDSQTHISKASVLALDELRAEKDQSGEPVALLETIHDPAALDPAQALDHAELKTALADAIATLPKKERAVIALYFYEELTLREIGEVIGVTESRASQLRTKAMLRLKARLAPREDAAPAPAPEERAALVAAA